MNTTTPNTHTLCRGCSGTGTRMRGFIRITLRTCRICHGDRYTVAVTR
ncbi:hypothetical protein [Yinghuangia seranimata]|nr:hypothetical protein [Yinghuangia seranimata]MDI2128750.1 hypothetical protein [Yinghuangia seranimata]